MGRYSNNSDSLKAGGSHLLTVVESGHSFDQSDAFDDHSSKGGDESTKSHGTSNSKASGGAAAAAATANLTKEEDKWVSRSKLVMVIVLLAATGLVASMTHRFTKREEEKDFQTRFDDFANQIISVYQINAKNIIDTYESLALSMTTYAVGNAANSITPDWPFVTIPEFAAIGGRALNQTGADILTLAPLVTRDDHVDWNFYSTANKDWIEESYAYQEAMGLNKTFDFAAMAGGPPPGVDISGGGGPPPGIDISGGGGPPPGVDVSGASGPPPGVDISGSGGAGPPPGVIPTAESRQGPPEFVTEGSGEAALFGPTGEITPFIYNQYPRPGMKLEPLQEPP